MEDTEVKKHKYNLGDTFLVADTVKDNIYTITEVDQRTGITFKYHIDKGNGFAEWCSDDEIDMHLKYNRWKPYSSLSQEQDYEIY